MAFNFWVWRVDPGAWCLACLDRGGVKVIQLLFLEEMVDR